jgi:V/A-type H+-transporting ATPase subunit K
MDFNTMLGYAGCACAVGISAMGSSIGCGIAGAASHGVMAKVEEGHGKFIGLSAAPSSQTIYGIVLMFVLLGKLKAEAGLAILGIGLFCGIGIMVSAILQGKVAATGILASSKKPEIFGKCFAAVGIVESFALFSMVFGLIIATAIG